MASSQRQGAIALGDDDDDDDDDHPLAAIGRSAASARGAAGGASSSPPPPLAITTTSIPGGYDFEPQGNEGGPSASGSRPRQRVSSDLQSPSSAGANSSSSYRRALTLGERILPASIFARLNTLTGNTNPHSLDEDHGLLFAHDGQDDDDADPHGDATSTYPPRGTPSHVPLPARPPVFAAPNPNARTFGGGQGNDGVFANLSAKPDGGRRGEGPEFVGGDDGGGGDKDEVPPAYEVAALDSTPPYWETTIITPQGLLGPDDICVDGLPVGSPFGFAWNLLVSMSFQFVGFLLTYLLHTTHAAKNGSRAGLGITLIQLGFYLKERVDHPELLLEGQSGDATGLEGALGPNQDDMQGWTWWGGAVQADAAAGAGSLATATMSAIGSIPTQIGSALSGALDASDPDALPRPTMIPSLGNVGLQGQEMQFSRMDQTTTEYMSFFLVLTGSFLLIGGVLSYWRALPSPPHPGAEPSAPHTATPSGLSGPPTEAATEIEVGDNGSPPPAFAEDSDEAMDDASDAGANSGDEKAAAWMSPTTRSSAATGPPSGAMSWSRAEHHPSKSSGSGRRTTKGDRGGGGGGGGGNKPFTLGGPDSERQETSKVLDKDYKGKYDHDPFMEQLLAARATAAVAATTTS
ncbi:hypothetical protein RQP46_006005 [Phenoliferia psychrophenolica]